MLTFLPPASIFWIAADLLQLLVLLILVEVIVSWAMVLGARGVSPYSPWVRVLRRLTDPVLEPFRRLVPPSKLGGIDISPILAIVVLQIVQGVLFRAGLGSF